MAYAFNDNKSKAEVYTKDEVYTKNEVYPKGSVYTKTEISTLLTNFLKTIYPVGAIYLSVKNTNPGTLFGGTWVSWGTGRVPVGVNTSDANFNSVEKTGGASTVTLTAAQMPSHTHKYSDFSTYAATGKSGSGYLVPQSNTERESNTSSAGSGSAHNNLQPYITCYMLKRTA